METANLNHEEAVTSLRKKHQDAVNEMSGQIDQLTKGKLRVEKEKQSLKAQIDESKAIEEGFYFV